MRFLRSLCFGLLVLTATAGYADDTLLCVQGKSFVPEHEFVQTRQLRFTADGPPLGDLLPLLAGRGVREKLWPETRCRSGAGDAFRRCTLRQRTDGRTDASLHRRRPRCL
jgi:hypothetical protein